MIIHSIDVKNFQSILHETLHCEQLTALVGANGAGKSTFLRALNLFYNPFAKISPDDYYNRNIANEVVIAITFTGLTAEAQQDFSSYMQGEFLTVERVFAMNESKSIGRYYGLILKNEEFQQIHDALLERDRGKIAKGLYDTLREKNEYTSLPIWSTIREVVDSLGKWEKDHPDKCTRRRDDGQFFGFTNASQGNLGRFTRLLYIPAVREASEDAAEARGSVLSTLLDLLIRGGVANKPEVIEFQQTTQMSYERIMDRAYLTELNQLGDQLTRTLKTFVPDAGVDLQWQPSETINIPMPKANIKLLEGGYSSGVERVGHGLQRAFILTMLQHLAVAQTKNQPLQDDQANYQETPIDNVLPNLVLAIEEPELYQHPNRQRHFAKILFQLASGKTPGVAEKTQVIYGTHSPLFIGIDRINQLRLVRKVSTSDAQPKITKLIRTNLDDIATTLWEVDGRLNPQYTAATLTPRLKAIMTPWMNEGFFADVVVLVEGEDDRAAILGLAMALGHDLESDGFAVIPCNGKTSLDRPALIFQNLHIPTYLIWDSDKTLKDPKPEHNHRLLKILGRDIIDWPCCVEDRFACFEVNLETMMKDEIGHEKYQQLLKKYQDEFQIGREKDARKNPTVIANLVEEAHRSGHRCETLEKIINKLLQLKQ